MSSGIQDVTEFNKTPVVRVAHGNYYCNPWTNLNTIRSSLAARCSITCLCYFANSFFFLSGSTVKLKSSATCLKSHSERLLLLLLFLFVQQPGTSRFRRLPGSMPVEGMLLDSLYSDCAGGRMECQKFHSVRHPILSSHYWSWLQLQLEP